MKPLVALIQPRATQGAARTNVRVSTGGSAAAAGIGGFKWEAAIVHRPRLTIELFSPALDGRTQLGRGDLVLNLNRIRAVSGIKTYFWLGAPITIYDATALDLTTAPVEFTGYVRSTSYDVDTDLLTLNFEVSATALDRPVLYSEFTGAGGINGDAALRGTLLPAGFGSVQNVEPVWFDNTNNIGMIDGYGNCTAITALFEGGNDFGARVADYADYATLLARILDHTVAPGRWATCVAQGLVGLGAPPVKPITVDATFGSNRTGAIIKRLLNVHAGVALGSIDTAALDAVDASLNYAVHYWTSDGRTVKDLCENLAAGINASMLVTFQGKYSIARAFGGSLAMTVNKQAPTRTTRVTKWRALDPDVPVWRMRARTGRPGTTLTIDQINYADTLIDRGVYASGTVYRQGNLVWSASGAQFLYINATPSAGQALPVLPATTTAYWSQTKPASTAADLVYADGTLIESLKPAQIGADVTGTHTASAIAGQGTLATANSADFSTQVTGTAKPSDSATAALTFSKVGTGTLSIVGNTISRTDAGTGWNTNAVSAQAFTGSAYISGLLPVGINGMLGLTDNAAGTSFTDLNEAWYYAGSAQAQIYRSGTLAQTLSSPTNGVTFSNTTRWSILYSGLFAYYFANGVLMATYQVTGGKTYRAGGAFNANGAKVDQVVFTPAYLQPDLASNIIDSGASYATVPRNEIRTPLGTAAAFTGQTAWATYSGLVPANVAGQVTNLDTSGNLSALDKILNRRLTLLLRADGSTALTEAMAITSLGIAASIAGQGAFATINSAAYGSSFLTGFGTLAPRSNVRFGTEVYRADGTTVTSDVMVVTSLGTAAAFTGQGALATLNNAAWGSNISGRPSNLAALGGTENINNALVPLGMNTIHNSGFDYRGNKLFGFQPGGTNSGVSLTHGVNLTGSPNWYGITSVAFVTANGTPASGTYFDLYYSWDNTESSLQENCRRWMMPVTPGDRVFASALVAAHRCSAYVNIQYLDGNGAYVTETGSSLGGRANGASLGDPANFDRLGYFDLVPAGVSFAWMQVRGIANGTGANPYVFATQEMLCKVDANQTAWPPYNTGIPNSTSALMVPGTGVRVGDQRNLPAITVANLGYKFTGTFTFSSSYVNSTTAQATVSISGGSLLIGNNTISLGSSTSATVTHAPDDSAILYQVYINNPNLASGTFSLLLTTNGDNVYGNDGYMWIGSIAIVFPSLTTGSTGGGGNAGGGGGGHTVDQSLP